MELLDRLIVKVSRFDNLGGMDSEDSRDWGVERLFGNNLPADLYEGDVDLGDSYYCIRQVGNICTAGSLSAVMTMQLASGENYDDPRDNIKGIPDAKPYDLWDAQKRKSSNDRGSTQGTATEEKGDYLRNSMLTAKVVGVPFIINGKLVNVKLLGFSIVPKSSWKTWIRKGYPIYTGSEWMLKRNKKGKLTAYDDEGFLRTEGYHAGYHCYNACQIKDGILGGKNTHGEKWGHFKDGSMLLDEKAVDKMFRGYVVRIDWEDLYKQLKSS